MELSFAHSKLKPAASRSPSSFAFGPSLSTWPAIRAPSDLAGHHDRLTGRHDVAVDGSVDRDLLTEGDHIAFDRTVDRDLSAKDVQVVLDRLVLANHDLFAAANLCCIGEQKRARAEQQQVL